MKNNSKKLIVGSLFRLFSAISVFIFYPAIGHAQSAGLSISVENRPLKEVLSLIEKKADMLFFYNDNDVDLKRPITLNLQNQPLEKVLNELFKSSPNSYRIRGKQIYILKRQARAMLVEEEPVKGVFRASGVVVDQKGEELAGAQVAVQDNPTKATMTDSQGRFSIQVSEGDKLLVSYIGYEARVVNTDKNATPMRITLAEDVKTLQEIVVVGYGQQKKESVVGAITQTKGSDLMRTGIATSVGQTLSGLLPGVTTITTSGMPGDEDPRINIRGLSSWNGSAPLVLIDGVERNMTDIDVGQIESISVLKDASATAVFGVKGANGVILITTKRGKAGKASVSFSSNLSFKSVSRMPNRLTSYDIYDYQNTVLEKQLPADANNWTWYLPQNELNKYRNPASYLESLYYPNVDWSRAVVKDFALTQRYDLNITGGTDFAKYFAAVSYTKDDDLLQSGLDVGLPYKPQWGFEHYTFRSNVDLNISPSTTFSVNLSGSVRQRQTFNQATTHIWSAFYRLSPAAYPIRYEDGAFGYNVNKPDDINPLLILSGGSSGLSTQYNTAISSDFVLKQDFDFITPGLSALLAFSYDVNFASQSSISYIELLSKSVAVDGTVSYKPSGGGNDMDFNKLPGHLNPETFSVESPYRRPYGKIQLNYDRSFGLHDLSALALVSREEQTRGSEFPHYREDWVGRLTYGYDDRYFFEANGAYNGSDQFSAKYRFDFFPSVGLGWMISNEKWMKKPWLDRLKIRYSIGKVGSDQIYAPRWSYMASWEQYNGMRVVFGNYLSPHNMFTSPGATYLTYNEASMGNPDLHWEVSGKQNFGLDFSLFKDIFSGSFEFFRDDRSDVFMAAGSYVVPSYFGSAPVPANLGKVLNQGFEFDLKLQQTWNGWHCWLRYNYMAAFNKVVYAADAPLAPAYQKNAGFPIYQPRVFVEQPGYTTSWDDLYGSVPYDNNNKRQPGDILMVDYNSDGVIDDKDRVPSGYTSTPQNTYNIFAGVNWKGFSFMMQFLGAYNVSQYLSSVFFSSDSKSPFVSPQLRDYWRPDNPNASYMLQTTGIPNGQSRGFFIDASYLRLKTAELSYTLSGDWLKKARLSALKFTLSGNNLFLWSKLPDDREDAIDIYASAGNLYPTLRRVNLGLNVTF